MSDFTFPTQSMINLYIDKKSFDNKQFLAPKLGIDVDATNFLQSPTTVEWDVIEPSAGVTKISALDAQPVNVGMRTIKTERKAPLMFRECSILSEAQLIQARKAGSSVKRAGDDLVLGAANYLNDRLDARIEKSCCEMLTGTLKDDEGHTLVNYGLSTAQKPNVSTTSGYGGNYWTVAASADPILDITKASEQLRYKDTYGIALVMDVSVLNYFLNSDAVKKLFESSPLSVNLAGEQIVNAFPQLLRAGISEIIVSTQGDSGAPFLSNKHAFLIGRSRSSALGAFASVPHVYSGLGADTAKAGKFMVIDDEFTRTQGAVPRVTITAGIHGLPVLYRPDLVVAMQVTA